MGRIRLVGYGIDTLVLNMRYCNEEGQPIKQELAEEVAQVLDDLQTQARQNEMATISPWLFVEVPLFVEPHGAGKQWRWLLTSRLLTLVVSRGTFNDLIAQMRFSSEFLWSEEWCGDALTKVHSFLMSIFGEYLHLQLSEVHLCADVVGYDFSRCNYETQFVTRVRKNQAICWADSIALDCHKVSTLAFSKHNAPLSCAIYNKSLEIKQKSGKVYQLIRQENF